MPVVACPIQGCTYATPDLDNVVIAALITAHATSHSMAGTAKAEKVKRPSISSAGTAEEWRYFESRWDEYKEATKISSRELILQLLECCDDALRKDLTRNAGGTLTGKTEVAVLAAIKQLAVREENVMVARLNLQRLKQDRDEAVRSYCARLRGQADTCDYVIKCPECNKDANYKDNIIRDVLICGLNDQDIQLDLLGSTNKEYDPRAGARIRRSQGIWEEVSRAADRPTGNVSSQLIQTRQEDH